MENNSATGTNDKVSSKSYWPRAETKHCVMALRFLRTECAEVYC